jgi:hypothetical protein
MLREKMWHPYIFALRGNSSGKTLQSERNMKLSAKRERGKVAVKFHGNEAATTTRVGCDKSHLNCSPYQKSFIHSTKAFKNKHLRAS